MDFSSVYLMSNAWIRGAMWVRPKEWLQTEYCLALARGEVFPERPVVFVHAGGGKPRDAIHADAPSLILYSDKVIHVLSSEGFTGWTTYAVEVYGKNGERVEGYCGFAVTGRCGPIDDSRRQRVVIPPAVPGGQPSPGLKGLYFDPNSWDGSDVFMAEGKGFIFVVESVKKALERAKVKNFYFRPLTEYVT